MTLEQINAEAPDQTSIHDFPDELLEVIFLINTSKSLATNQGNEDHTAYYDPHSTTLATAQVCRRWRTVALDYPVIWNRIIDYEHHSPVWIETLLTRSGSSPIEVGQNSVLKPIKLEGPRHKPILQSIFQRMTTLKTVSLQTHRNLWEYISPSLLERPAPNLEFLNLITSSPFPCIYPDPLFANNAPRLRRLHLQRCLINFSSAVLSNLTGLAVRNILSPFVAFPGRYPFKAVPSVSGWLRILRNLPSLRFLTLSSAIFHLTELEPQAPVVDLPHLVLLTISAKFYSGVSLIDRLNIPPPCGIAFRFYSGDNGLNSSKLLSFLSQKLAHWPRDHADRYLQARALSGYRIHFGNLKHLDHPFDMTEADKVEAYAQYSKDPMLSLVLTFVPFEGSFTFFNQLLELYNSTFLTTTHLDLWLDKRFAATDGSFPSFHTFHSFTNLKTLYLLDKSPLYLLPFFQHASLLDRPLFPSLQSLCLSGPHIDDEQGVLFRVFVAFFQWRAEARIPLLELNLLAGSISSRTADDLSRLGNLRVTLGHVEEEKFDVP